MGGVRPVTKRNAEKVRQIIIDMFPAYTRDADGGLIAEENLPVLREPGTGWGEHWVLCWEGGAPYEWPVLASGGGREEYSGVEYTPAKWPSGVFGEPINGVEMGIYRV